MKISFFMRYRVYPSVVDFRLSTLLGKLVLSTISIHLIVFTLLPMHAQAWGRFCQGSGMVSRLDSFSGSESARPSLLPDVHHMLPVVGHGGLATVGAAALADVSGILFFPFEVDVGPFNSTGHGFFFLPLLK
jgi:hypothetical protein